MSLHIIIDGYNLIRQSSSLSSLDQQDIQLGRESLLDNLIDYKKIKKHKITVVFDGTNAPIFSQQKDRKKGVTIKFSRQGETADMVIKRMVAYEKGRAMVVSSDREIIDFAETQGTAVISSTEFEKIIKMAAYSEILMEDEETEGWKATTKKKGPKRRLSRKARRSQTKIKKL